MLPKRRSSKKPPSRASSRSKERSARPAQSDRSVSIEERIRKPSTRISQLAVCVYGRKGSGKTTLLGTMPGKGIILDIPQVEGGTVVLADEADRLRVMPILRWEDFDAAFKYLSSEKGRKYDWVAIDSLTAAQELAKRRAINDREADLSMDPHTVTLQDWGKIGQLMSELIFKMKALKMHVIFTAQEKHRESDDTGAEMTPDISPASMTSLLPPLNLLGRLSVVEVEDEDEDEVKQERHLRVGPHRMYTTAARAIPGRELPAIIKSPHLGQILAYLLGKKVKRPAAVRQEAVPIIVSS